MHSSFVVFDAVRRQGYTLAIALVSGALAALPAPAPAAVPPTLAAASVPFIANQGQVDDQVAFYARTFAATVYVTKEGKLVYALAGKAAGGGSTAAVPGWAFTETLIAGNGAPVGSGLSPTRISSFVAGPKASPVFDAPTFERVRLGETAPGITVQLRATGSNVEKLFDVAPGREVGRIRVRVDGANRLSLGADGGLILATGLGDIEFTRPLAFQEHAGTRTAVPARYTLTGDKEYGFAVGAYDRTRPLVIDPLIRSTYSGGGLADNVQAMLIHPGSRDVFVAGSTTSTDFPGRGVGAVLLAGGTDAFVAHYSSDLEHLVKATYYGGTGNDAATAIAISATSGDIYIAGTTSSPTLPLGTEPLVVQPAYGGSGDAFIARFDGALTNLRSATYYGGTGADTAAGIVVDNISGDVIITGETASINLNVGAGGWQTASAGGGDAYVARFNATLSALNRGTYFGGTGNDRGLAIALDPITNDIYIAGSTTSTSLPGAANGALPTKSSLSDGFVARFDSGLTTLRQSTYFGGTGDDQINAIGVHPINGHIYVAGDTSSTDLRGKLSGQVTTGGNSDAFVARFVPELTGLLAVSYFGGSGDEFGKGLALSKYTGEVYVVGKTTSSALPGTGFGTDREAIQTVNAGGSDAFVARFDALLSGLKQATFLGGTLNDSGNAIGLSDLGVFVAGDTASSAFPLTSNLSAQQNISGTSDGFISQMSPDLRLANSSPAAFAFAPIINALPQTIQTSAPTLISPTGRGTGYVDGQPGSTWCASTTASCGTCELTGNAFIAGTTTLPAGTPYYVCVQHTSSAAPNVITETTMHIGAQAATFRVGTGAISGFGCTLDVDGNGTQDALTDGLLMLRALFGLTGTAVTNGAIGPNAFRTTWFDIGTYLNTNCGSNFGS